MRSGQRALDRRLIPAQDAEVLAIADRANTRYAAYARLGVAGLIAALVLTIGPGWGVLRFGECVVATNLGLAILGVVLVRLGRRICFLGSGLAVLDVVFLLGVTAFYTHIPGTAPGMFRPAVLSVWGIFVALSLSAVAGKPLVMLVQTVLFATGFGALVASEPIMRIDDPEVALAVSLVFGTGYNALRSVVILMTGALLALAAFRAQANLREAVAATRRADSLARFLPTTVAEIVADVETSSLLEGWQRDVSVLFADVRGFTALAETLSPRETARFLHTFRDLVTKAIEAEGGTVDKFIGDGVMGVFGLVDAPGDPPARAIRAACAMLAAVERWSRERGEAGMAPVRIGIGLHHGPAFVGAVGTGRLEFTVLGDTVNVASRLEQQAKVLDYDLVASAVAVAAGGVHPGLAWTSFPAVTVRGHREPLAVRAIHRTSIGGVGGASASDNASLGGRPPAPGTGSAAVYAPFARTASSA